MDGESIDIKQSRLQRLKELFPELFAENQLDWEKLKAAFGDDINFANERYVLNWAGKSDAFKILQQPTTATLIQCPGEGINDHPFNSPPYQGGEHEVRGGSENLFIEGENLEVLKVLQKAYYNKVKCIIIDPPYNTGSDSFIYPDKFSEKKEDYLKRIGDKDEEGFLMKEGLFRKNSKDSGHYHSNWLSMMYPRLFLAKNLLRDDGVIFVHIDDNEVHNLRMVMNEIFGEENFVECFIWRSRLGKGSTSNITAKLHEYIICYSKDKEKVNFLSDVRIKTSTTKERLRQWGQGDKKEDRPTMYYAVHSEEFGEVFPIKPDGSKGRWRVSKTKFEELLATNQVIFEKQADSRIEAYRIIPEGSQTETAQDSILNSEIVKTTAHGSKEISALFESRVFDYPKPTTVTKHLISISTSNNDIILDFFGGSGTTAQAALELNKEDGGNRKFILVQMPEQCDENSEAYKAGYKTIADIAKERIRRVIQRIKENTSVRHSRENGNPESLFGDKELDSRLRTAGMTKEYSSDNKLDLGFKVFKLSPSSFKIWRGAEIDSEDKLAQQLDAFTDPIRPGAEKQNMLYELMLKAGRELTSPIQHVMVRQAHHDTKSDNVTLSLSKGDIAKGATGVGYYSINNNNELIIALDAMNEKLIDQIIVAKPQKVITLDILFAGNDQLKTNTVLQMRDAGVDFKTI